MFVFATTENIKTACQKNNNKRRKNDIIGIRGQCIKNAVCARARHTRLSWLWVSLKYSLTPR